MNAVSGSGSSVITRADENKVQDDHARPSCWPRRQRGALAAGKSRCRHTSPASGDFGGADAGLAAAAGVLLSRARPCGLLDLILFSLLSEVWRRDGTPAGTAGRLARVAAAHLGRHRNLPAPSRQRLTAFALSSLADGRREARLVADRGRAVLVGGQA